MAAVNETLQTTIKFDAPDLWLLANHLNKVLSETGVMRRRLREVVMRSVVRNIRERFLKHANLALQMETIPKGRNPGEQPWSGAKQRYNANKTKAALEAEFEALSEAQGASMDDTIQGYRTRLEKFQRVFTRSVQRTREARRNPQDNDLTKKDKDEVRQALKVDPQKERILRDRAREQIINTRAKMGKLTSTGDIRKRITALQERLSAEQGTTPNGQPIRSHFLSKVRGEGLFRMNMAKLLTLISDMSLLDVSETRSGLGVGVGKLSAVESIKTPSATFALRGTPTKSRYTTFWRHLEFGTGVYIKRAGNPGGFFKHTAGGVAGAWYYGNDKNGIIAKGSLGMNFITDKNNNMYQADKDALLQEVDRFMALMLTGEYKDTGSLAKRYTRSSEKKTTAAKPVVSEQWMKEILDGLGYRN